MKNERKCRKCGNYIPTQVTIDGKKHNLQNRKFCLDCSPFGSHNTKTDDPARKAECANPYKDWSATRKKVHTARVYRKAIERKTELIKMAGGKCRICGYNKCHRALTFHHRNPDEKEFGLALNNLWSKSWERIEKEFNKCDLLCIRCHMEVEDELAPVNENSYRTIIGKFELENPPKVLETYDHTCQNCGKKFSNGHKNRKYCSPECTKIDHRKVERPSKEVLREDIQSLSWKSIGRKYGVSDNAVRKWARSYDLIGKL